jgi:hypothetical protein
MTVTTRFPDRVTFVWAALVTATLLSFSLGHWLGFHDRRYASTAIIVIAFIKIRFVILDFMEIRNAPYIMRIVAELWTAFVATALTVIYWLGTNPAAQAAWPHISGL